MRTARRVTIKHIKHIPPESGNTMPTAVEVASVGPVFADTSYVERIPE